MGNNAAYLGTVIEEKDGWKLGHNENPDVNLDTDLECILVSPTGKTFSGKYSTLKELLGDDQDDTAWRNRHA
jgi:hypothetical protein